MDNKIILDLALILLTAKLLGLLMRKIKVPEVVGALLAGIVLGPSLLNWVHGSEALDVLSKIGVLLIMFSAGIETDIKQIKSTGIASIVITFFGVTIPLALGYLLACCFNGFGRENLLTNLFYGVLLTATSVTITVATLKELGKLSSRVGTSIISAAILDDILGIIILTIFIGLDDPTSSSNPWLIFAYVIAFFAFAFVFGVVCKFFFDKLEKRHRNNRRLVILGLVLCFLFSYAAEKLFHLADITGAFIAGIIISNLKSADYIEHRVDISSYMIFGPVFFASIGINTALQGFSQATLWFGLLFVVIGLISKFIGCGLGARICKYSRHDSCMVGLGMMARAEVILITAQKGVELEIMDPKFMPFVIMLVILSSLLTPILLKLVYKSKNRKLKKLPSTPSAM